MNRQIDSTDTGRGYVGIPVILAGLLQARKLYGSDQVQMDEKIDRQIVCTGTGRGYVGIPGIQAGLLQARKLYGSNQIQMDE